MRKILICILSSLLVSGFAYAQKNGSIRGVAYDTSTKMPVSNVTITLMLKKDSSLVSFTMTDNSGRFELTNVAEGEYRLLFSHVNYHNNSQVVKIDETHKLFEMGNIVMTDKSKTLTEVVVTAEAPPVTLVGDTVQYNAGSFKTQPNANVEDLLKKLPGVKVEKDGTVKAQGETVKKVLVDGKEFFGNDPKMATKNLPADAIDKVQVFDKLSDQAQLTGFDDGNSEKTINLKLKKDKKKGTFGKINGGAGDQGRFQGRANVNSFKGARQMSVLGMGNNTNSEGFSFMDVLNFTGALNQLKNGGNVNFTMSADDPMAGLLGGNNNGINTIFGGGINYNNIIGTKTDFQSNYFFSHYNPNRRTNVQRKYTLPENFYNQNSYTDNVSNNHRLNFNADIQIDSFHSIKISPNFNYQKTSNKSLSDYSTRSDVGIKINDGESDNLSNNEGYTFSNNILFRKRFHRKGRTFSVNLLTNLNSSGGDGNLKSITEFYDQAGALLIRDSINQKNNIDADLKGYNARMVYTEPIFKRTLLEFSVGNSWTRSTSSKITYDYNKSNGKFDQVNDNLTNDYENSYKYINGGLRLRKQTKNYNYMFGASFQRAELEGKVISGTKDSVIGKVFRNVLPNARFQYYFSRFKNVTLNYSTSTNQPSVSQLQPVPDNTNPLYIKEGNPNLKQEFTQTLRLNAQFVSPYKNKNFFAFFTVQQTQNKIVNYDRINSFGVDSVMPVNVNGVVNLNGNLNYGLPVRFLKGNFEIGTMVNYYKGKQFINTQMNRINTVTVGPDVSLNMSPTGEINLSFDAGVSYSVTQYSLDANNNTQYLTQNYGADFDMQLPKKFYFATDFDYSIVNLYRPGPNTNIPLWNASISRQILNFNRGEIKFAVKDILDKNIRVNRTTNQNYIEDTRTNSLRRFFMLSFTYSLSKTGLSNQGPGGMKMISR
jgi:5-hydroxyisourate hydrolase-like protein (transthyretin family)